MINQSHSSARRAARRLLRVYGRLLCLKEFLIALDSFFDSGRFIRIGSPASMLSQRLARVILDQRVVAHRVSNELFGSHSQTISIGIFSSSKSRETT